MERVIRSPLPEEVNGPPETRFELVSPKDSPIMNGWEPEILEATK